MQLLVNNGTAEHYTWGQGCDGWHLLRNAGLSVIEECMPPGTAEVRHHHGMAQQFFYLLSGTAIMEIEGRILEMSAGDGAQVLPGVRHQIRNESKESIRFLVISQPPSHADRTND
ncbi:MAG: cupin domain-containing protein [Acidobacteria bacterium]|nr:MAG: cupin domain-containing protein [Acidobacteriota bacterium]